MWICLRLLDALADIVVQRYILLVAQTETIFMVRLGPWSAPASYLLQSIKLILYVNCFKIWKIVTVGGIQKCLTPNALKRRNGVEGFIYQPHGCGRRWRSKNTAKNTYPSLPPSLSLIGDWLDPRSRSILLVFGCLRSSSLSNPTACFACSAGFTLVPCVVQPSSGFSTFHVRYCLLWISIPKYVSRSLVRSLHHYRLRCSPLPLVYLCSSLFKCSDTPHAIRGAFLCFCIARNLRRKRTFVTCSKSSPREAFSKTT
jgi:hypothetical protein